jgi:hypothetical protein
MTVDEAVPLRSTIPARLGQSLEKVTKPLTAVSAEGAEEVA